jgi:xanthosine utilization system XapX-like protein
MKKLLLPVIGGVVVAALFSCGKETASAPPAEAAAPVPAPPVPVPYYGYVGTRNGSAITNTRRVMVLASSSEQAKQLFRQQYGSAFCVDLGVRR